MLIKRDILRALKSFHIQVVFIITILFSGIFTFFVANGNKIGISVFGNLTTYKDLSEVLLNGLDYTKGLGFLVTFAIALFISEEYQFNTWQHYICSGRKRTEIYISRYIFALMLAITIFLMYTLSSYFVSVILGKSIDFSKFIFIIRRGVIVYMALTSIVVFLSMSLKNHIAGILGSLAFIFLEKDIISMLINIFNKININIEAFGKFTLMKINAIAPIDNINILTEMFLPCVLIIIVSTLLGNYCFSKFEV